MLLLVTAAATVAFDLVVAVGVGVALASLMALRAVADATAFDRDPIDEVDIDATVLLASLRPEHRRLVARLGVLVHPRP